mmetsp:Transcript_64223/g.105542  ORF Transcript_64223/g.105542 Transcript_64223/m.105542 type:complete len:211 (+) Transcript_64223:206-838(+)
MQHLHRRLCGFPRKDQAQLIDQKAWQQLILAKEDPFVHPALSFSAHHTVVSFHGGSIAGFPKMLPSRKRKAHESGLRTIGEELLAIAKIRGDINPQTKRRTMSNRNSCSIGDFEPIPGNALKVPLLRPMECHPWSRHVQATQRRQAPVPRHKGHHGGRPQHTAFVGHTRWAHQAATLQDLCDQPSMCHDFGIFEKFICIITELEHRGWTC